MLIQLLYFPLFLGLSNMFMNSKYAMLKYNCAECVVFFSFSFRGVILNSRVVGSFSAEI